MRMVQLFVFSQVLQLIVKLNTPTSRDNPTAQLTLNPFQGAGPIDELIPILFRSASSLRESLGGHWRTGVSLVKTPFPLSVRHSPLGLTHSRHPQWTHHVSQEPYSELVFCRSLPVPPSSSWSSKVRIPPEEDEKTCLTVRHWSRGYIQYILWWRSLAINLRSEFRHEMKRVLPPRSSQLFLFFPPLYAAFGGYFPARGNRTSESLCVPWGRIFMACREKWGFLSVGARVRDMFLRLFPQMCRY